ALPEYFATDVDDVFSVGIVLTEDKSLRNERATGEKLRQRVPESLKDGADLIFHYDRAIEFLGAIGEVVVEFFPAKFSRFLMAFVDEEAFLDQAALFGDLRADAVNVVADIDAISDGAFVRVFADEVLIKETDGLFAGRGGEPDKEGVEVFE